MNGDAPAARARLADDMLALLDVLGVEQTGYLGRDWGGWTGWLLGIRAPERFTRMLLMGNVHPWTPRPAALLDFWRTHYHFQLRELPALAAAGSPARGSSCR